MISLRNCSRRTEALGRRWQSRCLAERRSTCAIASIGNYATRSKPKPEPKQHAPRIGRRETQWPLYITYTVLVRLMLETKQTPPIVNDCDVSLDCKQSLFCSVPKENECPLPVEMVRCVLILVSGIYFSTIHHTQGYRVLVYNLRGIFPFVV